MGFECRLGADASLRQLEETDAAELFLAVDANRAYLRERLPWVDATRSVEDVRAFIQRGLAQDAAGRGFQAGIFHQGGIAGAIGYPAMDEEQCSITIGYWVAEASQGRGLATRATQALVDHAFEVMNLERVEIRCAVDNVRSRCVPERLGFKLEVILPRAEELYGRRVDTAVYAVLAGEWRARRRLE
jgi:ribosomal-protein-serine acetyltransferase